MDDDKNFFISLVISILMIIVIGTLTIAFDLTPAPGPVERTGTISQIDETHYQNPINFNIV